LQPALYAAKGEYKTSVWFTGIHVDPVFLLLINKLNGPIGNSLANQFDILPGQFRDNERIRMPWGGAPNQKDEERYEAIRVHAWCDTAERVSSPMAAHRERSNCQLTPPGRHSVERLVLQFPLPFANQ
jgi:hypothetical protein